MRCLVTPAGLAMALALVLWAEGVHAELRLDTGAIDTALGTVGQAQGDIYKISLPRTDLSVSTTKSN